MGIMIGSPAMKIGISICERKKNMIQRAGQPAFDIKLYMEWKRKFEKEDQKNVPVTEVGIANSTAPIYPGATWYSSKTMTNSPWLLK